MGDLSIVPDLRFAWWQTRFVDGLKECKKESDYHDRNTELHLVIPAALPWKVINEIFGIVPLLAYQFIARIFHILALFSQLPAFGKTHPQTETSYHLWSQQLATY